MNNKELSKTVGDVITSTLAAVGALTVVTGVKVFRKQKKEEKARQERKSEKLETYSKKMESIRIDLDLLDDKTAELEEKFSKLSENDITKEDGVKEIKEMIEEEENQEAKEILEKILELREEKHDLAMDIVRLTTKVIDIARDKDEDEE